MKIKYSLYCLLLLVACKDGGGIISSIENRPLGWSFNQALIGANFSSGETNKFAQNPGQVYTYSTGSTKFSFSSNVISCNPIPSNIQINNIPADFSPATCGIGVVTYYDDYGQLAQRGEYYYITVSRSYGTTVEILTLGFLGKSPTTGYYSLLNVDFLSGYSIYERDIDGTYRSSDYYYVVNGMAEVNTSNGFRVTTNNLLMRSFYTGRSKFFKFSIGCCSN